MLHQEIDELLNGPTRMVVAYPVENQVEDLPRVWIGQFTEAVNSVAKDARGLVVIINDGDEVLASLQEQYILINEQFVSQYQIVSVDQITSGEFDLESIEDSTEVLIVIGDQLNANRVGPVKHFLVESCEKILRERSTMIVPRVVVFATELEDPSWLPDGSRVGRLSISESGRDIRVQRVSTVE